MTEEKEMANGLSAKSQPVAEIHLQSRLCDSDRVTYWTAVNPFCAMLSLLDTPVWGRGSQEHSVSLSPGD